MNRDAVIAKINSVQEWYHQIEILPGIVTPGVNDCGQVLDLLDLPADCHGLRVLDLGTRDGFFAFELERRGAAVLAIDYMPSHTTGFDVARDLLNSQVEYIQENIYNLSARQHGTFDIVLFLGLIYHLPDPMLALRIVRSLCRRQMYLESHICDQAFLLPTGALIPLASISEQLVNMPLMQFLPGDSLNHDPTNYWSPNLACLEAMAIESDFDIIWKKQYGGRGLLRCTVAHDPRRKYLMNLAWGTSSEG